MNMAQTPPRDQTIGVQGRRADAAAYPKLTTEDALRYLNEVKRAFANKEGKYATFGQLLIDAKNKKLGTIDIDFLMLRVKELLQGHKKLKIGFNTFLPEEYRMKLDEEDDNVHNQKISKILGIGFTKPQEACISMATVGDVELSYLKEVKREFANNEGKYTSLLQLLIDAKNKRIDIDTLMLRIKELLRGHKKLILGFNTFLPEKYRMQVDEVVADSQENYYYEEVSEDNT
ncbi:unnamed protein product [Thlaspi arvense]|uniref:Uncharacterized protein n=1 Tax=Thlaspi arvense TaxID=13288 RepID=A0AAU9TAF1_THLAR|nr:unnamed protein product [Thlaspi arvense]